MFFRKKIPAKVVKRLPVRLLVLDELLSKKWKCVTLCSVYMIGG